jgi:hypothetical protein
VLQRHVQRKDYSLITCLIRHVDLGSTDRLWDGPLSTMPTMSNLRTVVLNARGLKQDFDGQCFSKILVPSIRELHVETSPTAHQGTIASSSCWLSTLRQNCSNLVVLSLDIYLPSAACTDLELLLLGTNLQHLTLGPLVNDALDDWGVAMALSQKSLVTLELHRAITEDTMDILRRQCGGLGALERLQALKATIEEEAVVSLLSFASNLTTLDVTLTGITASAFWWPGQALFDAMSQLAALSHLNIIYEARLLDGGQTSTTVAATSLLALTVLPLRSLSIAPCGTQMTHLLNLQQITGEALLQLCNKWETLSSFELELACEEIICDEAQRAELGQRLSALGLKRFFVHAFTEPVYMNSNIWLGANKSFCPDPQQWVPRQLHYGTEAQDTTYAVEAAEDRDDLLV